MTLDGLQTAIVAGLDAMLDGAAAAVQGHRGQFESLDEIKRLAVKNPAVLVALRGFRNPMQLDLNELHATVQCVVYVLTADRPQLPRGTSAQVLVSIIAAALDDQRWGIDAGAPEDIVGRNITTNDIDKAGVCLWSIAWLQTAPIAEPLAVSYGLLNEIFGTHELGTEDQATDQIPIDQ